MNREVREGRRLRPGWDDVLPLRGWVAVPLLCVAAGIVLFVSPPASALGFATALGTTLALAILVGTRPPRGGHKAARRRAAVSRGGTPVAFALARVAWTS